jgi:hypothetical protein
VNAGSGKGQSMDRMVVIAFDGIAEADGQSHG